MSEAELQRNGAEGVTFALVHGAHHDEHAWDKLRPRLEALGHNTVAMTLPIDQEDVTLDTYAACIRDALAECDENVVLVGHSRMGRAIPRVPALRPVQRLVYLNAVVLPAADQVDQTDGQPPPVWSWYDAGRRRIEGTPFVTCTEKQAILFYSDAARQDDPEVEFDPIFLTRIIRGLRPQNHKDASDLPLQRQPDVPTSVIVSTEDMVVRPDFCRFAAERYLGVRAMAMAGGHSPHILRPARLAQILHSIATERAA